MILYVTNMFTKFLARETTLSMNTTLLENDQHYGIKSPTSQYKHEHT